MSAPDDYLLMSGIQHFCFCRRQWALIHLEQQWSENLRTAEGRLEHTRCHDTAQTERRGDLLITRGMKVVSHRLRLSGDCDVVEFRADPEGIPLQHTEGRWRPMPVEYKHGRAKENDADRLQLCAQAMALEEMLACDIPQAALFYEETRRRELAGHGRRDEPVFRPRLHSKSQAGNLLQRLLPQRALPARTVQTRRPQGLPESLSGRSASGGHAMRQLLTQLYVTSEDAYLSLDDENVVVSRQKTEIGRVPLHTLEGIVCFSRSGASPALMGKCAAKGIDLCFFSPYGQFLARTVGEERGNVLLRQTQYRISDSEALSCRYARYFILGKVYNARWVLERATRDHPQRVPIEELKRTSAQLAAALPLIEQCDDLDQLRGLEGEAAQRYFDCFDSLILQQHEAFPFVSRNRRPPLDNVNALLSFAYSLLARDCASALSSVGLDPYVGFLHRARPGRRSLALDLMEELRAVYADRFVLSCINQKLLTAKHFQKQENGAVLLTDDGRRAFLKAWQTKKQEQITHPFLKEKLPWGLVPYVQALLLARTLRGDLELYPPFFWK